MRLWQRIGKRNLRKGFAAHGGNKIKLFPYYILLRIPTLSWDDSDCKMVLNHWQGLGTSSLTHRPGSVADNNFAFPYRNYKNNKNFGNLIDF